TVTCLGHTVSDGQVFPDTKNLDSIRKAVPTTLPLANLTKENVPFKWSKLEQTAFETLKNALTLEPCLKLPDFSKPFKLCTSASKFALGAVLVPDDEGGFQHPVASASRKLNVIGKVIPVVFEIQRIDKPTDVQNVHVNRLIWVVGREAFPRSRDISDIGRKEGQKTEGRDRKSGELDNNLPPRSLPFLDSGDDERTERVRCDPMSSCSPPPLVPIPSSQTAQTATQSISPSSL
ncbi:hypothetical protein AVEN_171675-1, partial [Araneus ventricosus]